jgi:hypothetical protein
MMADPDPARLAATDQELAALDARLDRNARAIMRGDVTLLLLAAAGIAYALIARQPVSYWHYAAVWGVVVLGAAGSFIQGRLLRSYRAEIRDLRARVR